MNISIRHWGTVGLLAALSWPIHAQLQPVELHDHELAQLRGRFVMPGHIVHFGVTMNSIWQDASGQVIGGQVNMQVGQGMYQPQFSVSTITSDSLPAAASAAPVAPGMSSGQIAGGAGLDSVAGIVQSSRSAGDFNTVANNLMVNVSRGQSAPAGSDGGQALGSGLAAANGAGQVAISPGNGGLRIEIQTPGQGSSWQQLGAGGLRQQANINGSFNTVRNLASLDVVLRSGLSGEDLNCNIDQLRNLRPMGY